MKILLLGKNGQVGWELQRSLALLGQVVALDRQGQDGLCGDLTHLESLRQTVRAVRPQVIVNAAAYTAVDRAEREPDLARRVNALAPGVLAQEAAALRACLVHYSTDYVFDGSGDQPWREDDAPAPLNVYGQTKLEGEQAIAATGAKHLIFRTSWVYAARGNNFAKTMLRLAQERDQLKVVADQVGAPTGAELLADVTAHALRQVLPSLGHDELTPSGIYHLAAAGETHWCDYARYALSLAQQAGRTLRATATQVQPITSAEFPVPARRPLNSRLDGQRFESTFGIRLPHWQVGVARMLAEILEQPTP